MPGLAPPGGPPGVSATLSAHIFEFLTQEAIFNTDMAGTLACEEIER